MNAVFLCQGCGERMPVIDTDEFVNWFSGRHVPHLGADQYILVYIDEDEDAQPSAASN